MIRAHLGGRLALRSKQGDLRRWHFITTRHRTGKTARCRASRGLNAMNGPTSSSSAAASPGSLPPICWPAAGKSVVLLERERCAQIDTGPHERAPDHGHRHTADRSGRTVRPRSRAGGVGRGPGGDRADRRHRARRARSPASSTGCPAICTRPLGGTGDSRRRVPGGSGAGAPSSASMPRSSTQVPFVGGPGVRFDGQARFHPRKYLAGARARGRVAAACASTSTVRPRSSPTRR